MKALNAINRTDISRAAQNILVPIFAEACGFSCLRNLDLGADGNFPGIDLADDDARVVIQITATPGLAKVKHTLHQFLLDRAEFNPPLAKRYDRVIVYVLTERQKTYSQKSIDAELEGRFKFDASEDVWDFRTLIAIIEGLPMPKKTAILEAMRSQIDFTRSLMPIPEVVARRLNALEDLWALRRNILPVKRHPDMDWHDALEDIALNLESHSTSLRGILDRAGAILPRKVTDLLESAAAAAQDGALEMSLKFSDHFEVPIQACRDAERMYELLTEATEQLRLD